MARTKGRNALVMAILGKGPAKPAGGMPMKPAMSAEDKGEGETDAKEMGERQAAREFLDAVKSDDEAKVVDALESLIETCYPSLADDEGSDDAAPAKPGY
jgi:hypothetical protein